MVKDAYYFSHDANARHDPKIVTLCQNHKIAGYAYFFILMEMLREQSDYKISKKFIPAIAMAWGCVSQAIATEILNEMVEIGLIKQDENCFWSESLNNRMLALEHRRTILSEAGKLGNQIRWENHRKANAKQSQPNRSKVKESKVKESKDVGIPANPKIKHLSAVYLTPEEHAKLIEKFGKEKTAVWIYDLNNYLMTSGKKSKSHYHTILVWDRREEKRHARPTI